MTRRAPTMTATARGTTFLEYLVGLVLAVTVVASGVALFGKALVTQATCAAVRIGLLDRVAHADRCAGPQPKLAASATGLAPTREMGEAPELICDHDGCVPSYCFAAGTPVATPDGLRPIESLAGGDEVVAVDAASGEASRRRVLGTKVTPEAPLFELTVARDGDVSRAETFLVTGNHPFLEAMPSGQTAWRGVRWLEAGARLVTERGTVAVLRVADAQRRATVYNLEVEGLHTYLVGDAHAVVHNAYYEDPETEITRAELQLGARTPTPNVTARLASGDLAKTNPHRLAKPPATATLPQKTTLAAMEKKVNEAHAALVAARPLGEAAALAAAERYRNAVKMHFTAIDALRKGAPLEARAPVAAATLQPARATLTEAEKIAVARRMLAVATRLQRTPDSREPIHHALLREFLPPAEFARFEKVLRDLKPTAESIRAFEQELERTASLLPSHPDLDFTAPRVGYRLSVYRELRIAGKGTPDVAQALARAEYDDAKLVVASPAGRDPVRIAWSKDLIAAYEGKNPTYEAHAAKKSINEAELKATEAKLAELDAHRTDGAPSGAATGRGAQLAREHAQLESRRAALQKEQRDLQFWHERDVVEHARTTSAKELAPRVQALAKLEAERQAATDAETAKRLDAKIAKEKADLAEARKLALVKAKDALVDESDLRARADAMWLRLRDWQKSTRQGEREREIQELTSSLETLGARVYSLKEEVEFYQKEDGPKSTKRIENGKVVDKAVVEKELADLTVERDLVALRLAQAHRDLAVIRRDEANGWRAFYEAERAARAMDLRLAQIGLPPRKPLPAKWAAMIRAYNQGIGMPLPAESAEQGQAAWAEHQLDRVGDRLRETEARMPWRAKELVAAEAALAAAKRRLDEANQQKAIRDLAGPPPAPKDDDAFETEPMKERRPKVPVRLDLPEGKGGDLDEERLWEDFWDGLDFALENNRSLSEKQRMQVARAAKKIADAMDRLDKAHDRASDRELKELDAEVAAVHALTRELREELGAAIVAVPGLETLFDAVDALMTVRKNIGHFAIGVRKEIVKAATGLVGVTAKAVRFGNDGAYRREVKLTLEKLGEMIRDPELRQLMLKQIEEEFERDPAQALGRMTGFILTFFIPFEKGFDAVRLVGKGVQSLEKAGKTGRTAAEIATLARDLTAAAKYFDEAAKAAAKTGREATAALEAAKTMRAAHKAAEAHAEIAKANGKIASLLGLSTRTQAWETDAAKAVAALKAAGADAKTIAAAERDLAAAKAAVQEVEAAQKAVRDAIAAERTVADVERAGRAVTDAAKAGDLTAPHAQRQAMARADELRRQIAAKREIGKRLELSIQGERQAARDGRPVEKDLAPRGFNQDTRNGASLPEVERRLAQLDAEATRLEAELAALSPKSVGARGAELAEQIAGGKLGRHDAIARLYGDLSPAGGTVHVVGPSGDGTQWLVPLLSERKVVVSEVDEPLELLKRVHLGDKKSVAAYRKLHGVLAASAPELLAKNKITSAEELMAFVTAAQKEGRVRVVSGAAANKEPVDLVVVMAPLGLDDATRAAIVTSVKPGGAIHVASEDLAARFPELANMAGTRLPNSVGMFPADTAGGLAMNVPRDGWVIVKPVAPAKPALTEAQRASLRFYTGTGYEGINPYLRTGEVPRARYDAKELDVHVKNLDAAIDAQPLLPPRPLYRGLDGEAPRNLREMKVGDRFTEPGFVSTTESLKTADEFTNGEGVALKIVNPETVRGVGAANAYESSEILLKRGLTFEAVEVITDPAKLKLLGFPYAPRLVVLKIVK